MSTQPIISVLTYRTDDNLDSRLAAIGYDAVRGWPDQRPITKDLVASRLSPPPDAGDTVVATVTVADQLVGWGAIRPAVPGGTARLWGPIVHPATQGHGLGGRLLETLMSTTTFAGCRDRLTTAEVPAKRATARAFFAHAGWRSAGGATLLHASPIPRPARHAGDTLTIEPLAGDVRSIAPDVARLYRATNPHHSDAVAAVTLERWAADRRYRPDHVLLAHDPFSRVAGAALLYPLAHVEDTEPPEVLLADVLLDQGWQDPAALEQLVAAALDHAATLHPDSVFRAITGHKAIVECLVSLGAAVTDDIVYFACPSPAS